MSSITTIPIILLVFMTTFITNHSSSARTLTPNDHNHHHKLTFFMQHLLNTSSSSAIKNPNFPLFSDNNKPPNKAIPIPQYPSDDQSQTTTQLDLSSLNGLPFPSIATLQDMELGKMTLIMDQELLVEEGGVLVKIGRAEGVYVASKSDDDSSHMMAMSANFDEYDDDDDGGGGSVVLRMFGVHRSDVLESHVAVIGGTGKYEGANGYAVVKVVDRVGYDQVQGFKAKVMTSEKFLLFDVYLS